MTTFSTGLSSLQVSQYAMDVISNNIANADTDGFHRRRVHLESLETNRIGRFQIGNGVSLNYIERIRNSVTESSLTFAIADVSRVDQTLEIERQIESLFQSGEGSIHQQLDEFFGEISKLTSSPDELTQRSSVIEEANHLARLFQQTQEQLYELRSSIRNQIEGDVDVLNSKIKSMAELNTRITRLEKTSDPQFELDQLDAMVNDVAQMIDVSRNERGINTRTITFGQSSFQLGSANTELNLVNTNDGDLAVVAGDSDKPVTLNGGRLSSLLDAYNNTIPEFIDKLDELAAGLINQIDQIHAKGVGPSGSFTILDGTRSVNNSRVPLADTDLAFPVDAGELTISILDPDGNRRTETISIDPETQSLEDIATAISAIDDIFASVNQQTNQFQILASPGYQFDFSGNLETQPNLDNYTGTSAPVFSGNYLGSENQTLSYEISGSGEVGISEDLFVNVYNEDGDQLTRISIGNDYEAGSPIEIYEGVTISFSGGTVVDSDSFESKLVSNSDTSGILSALGLNSFFSGDSADSISVDRKILEDNGTFASGKTSDVADTTNLFSLLEQRDVRVMSGNTRSFNEYLNEVTTSIGISVQNNTQLSVSLTNLQTRYQQDRDAVSGVDLNEELVHLQQFQRQYEASVRVIQTAETMFNELFRILQ